MNTPVLLDELQFKMVRASGAGGQHVNKVATKVVLHFNLEESSGLTHSEKELLLARLANKLTVSGQLQMQCGETRSQLRNKRILIQRFLGLIEDNLKVEAPRKPSKIPRGVVKKRIENKKRQSQKKANRKPPEL